MRLELRVKEKGIERGNSEKKEKISKEERKKKKRVWRKEGGMKGGEKGFCKCSG